MGKKFLTLLSALVLAVSCTGCSLLHREWYEVTAHSSGYYEGRDALRADTYQDLVNDILVLVGNHSEEGVIWLYYAQEGLDADDAAERACRDIHFPEDFDALEQARRRLTFEELFYLAVGLTFLKQRRSGGAPGAAVPGTDGGAFLSLLPFCDCSNL